MANKQNKQTVTILTDEKNPEPMELIAKAIIDIADAYQKIRTSRVKERVIVLLIKDYCGQDVSLGTIYKVLGAIENLKKAYIKELPK